MDTLSSVNAIPRGLLRLRRHPFRGPLVALAARAGPPRLLGTVRRVDVSFVWDQSLFRARTIPESQAALDWLMTVAMLCHALLLQFFADLGGRRDRVFRALVTGLLAFLAV